MKKLTICSLMMLTIPTVGAEEFYLEGITTLGAKKSAYLSVKGGKMTVREGESIGTWQVVRIERQTVILATDQGITTELALHTRFDNNSSVPTDMDHSPVMEAPVVETTDENTSSEEVAEFSENTSLPAANPPTTLATATNHHGVPAGYRKVQTPFGAVLVEEKSMPKEPSHPDSPETKASDPPSLNKIADDAIPPGQHRVRTPFGDVLIKDKPTTVNAE